MVANFLVTKLCVLIRINFGNYRATILYYYCMHVVSVFSIYRELFFRINENLLMLNFTVA